MNFILIDEIISIQVDEVEVKKDRNSDSRERHKAVESRRPPRKEIKDKKDRTLDPMDPASYSDIPRYDLLILHNFFVHLLQSQVDFTVFFLYTSPFTEVNGQMD